MDSPRKSQHKGNAKNFQRNEKVQVMRDGQWVDYSKPCGSKLVVELAVKAMTIYGQQNVRIAQAV